MTAAAGALLLASLFLPWFSGGVSGWEHFVWADVALAAVAAVLVAAAVRPLTPLRIAAAILCGLGIAVVLGHGFAPDAPTDDVLDVGPGGYVALAGLTAGAIRAQATWPRWGGAVLLAAGAAGLVGALFSTWGPKEPVLVFFGLLDSVRAVGAYDNGFERWHVLDVALLGLAAALVVAAVRPLPAVARAALGAAALAAAACVLIGIDDKFWIDEGIAVGAAEGPVVALLALAAALAGLVLVRPRDG